MKPFLFFFGIFVGLILANWVWITTGEAGIFIPNVGGYVWDWSQ